MLVFNVTSFKIDQNQNQNCPTDKLQNLRKKKKVTMQRLSPRFRSQQFFVYIWYVENFFPEFIEICMEMPCWSPSRWAPTWQPKTNRNICHWVLLQKREFISRGFQEHWNNTFPNTWTVQVVKFREISHFFNQHDSSLGRHVNASSGKSSEIQA